METKLESVAAKARSDANLRFTSLAHHVTRERIWESLCHIPRHSAPGVDGIGVETAKASFGEWVDEMIRSIHHKGYQAPAVRRVWIPKPGKSTKRPLGVPCVADRALQRSVATVLGTIYEQDFLPCSFGGRPGIGAHHALATFHEIMGTKDVRWVLEADLKNFFGSLNHEWLLRFVEHRVGDPRILSLIRRWLKAGILEDGKVRENEAGTPQGGSISVLLSNLYLHYALDLWFTKAIKPRLKGEAYLIRYVDDFAVCFQHREDALRFRSVLEKRLGRFGLELEPDKTRLVEFGKLAAWKADNRGGARETVYFLGFTHYMEKSRKGRYMLGRKTEKSRFRRSVAAVEQMLHAMMHRPLREQADALNQKLRGHYAYYGMGGNRRGLIRFHRVVLNRWRRVLMKRGSGYLTWEKYHTILKNIPLRRPTLAISLDAIKGYAVL